MPPRRKPSATTTNNTFAEALKFVALICKDHGTIYETHARIDSNCITAYNGILSCGHYVDNDLLVCPNINLAVAALSKCGQNIAITQLDNRLSIKSDKFRAIIPCLELELLLHNIIPDEPCAIIDQRLIEAFVLAVKDEIGESIYSKSVLLNGETLISSFNGQMVIEYWHGINLPQGLSIPKALIGPLLKINKKVTKFGFSQSSITIYFEDESWIRSQLYAEQWPENRHVFNCTNNMQPFPADFWKGLAAVSSFGEGLCYARDGKLCSHPQDNAGAEFSLDGLLGSWCYPIKQLASLQAWASHVDFQAQGANGPCLYAAGKQARAVIAGIRQEQKSTHINTSKQYDIDDKIPY